MDPSNPRWTERLSQLYASTVYNSTPSPPGFGSSDPAFVSMVKSELESSGDAKLVGTVGVDLARLRIWAGTDEMNGSALGTGCGVNTPKRCSNARKRWSLITATWSEGLEMLRAKPEDTPSRAPSASSRKPDHGGRTGETSHDHLLVTLQSR